MEGREAFLSELEEARERAAAFVRARLEAVSAELKESTARLVAEMDVILPPDLEILFPMATAKERLDELAAPAEAGSPTLESLRALDRGRAQSEVLQELLRQLEPWCQERAIVVFREGAITGWSGAGFAGADPVRGWRGSLTESPGLQRVADGTPVLLRTSTDGRLAQWVPGRDVRLLAVPMSLRGKIVGALLAFEGETALAAEIVQLLTYLTGLLLETLAVRPTVPTPALLDPVDASAAVAEPEAPSEEAVEFEAPPTPEPAAPVVPEAEEPAAQPDVAAPQVEAMPSVEDGGETVHLKVPVTPQVPTRAPEEERKHEEARRFARLLVSEIRLYNEQAVQEGRAARDIYQRLKEDIDRSREMYEQRVPADVRANSNYFFEELVRILADGDADALGL